MKCTICNKEVVLVPSAQERARKYGGKASDYTKLFPRHAECELIKRGCKPGPYPRSPCEFYNTMSNDITVTLKIDWPLLYQQKLLLIHLKQTVPACKDLIEDLLLLIRTIQDQGNDKGMPVFEHLPESNS